jgi:hypothetical protein
MGRRLPASSPAPLRATRKSELNMRETVVKQLLTTTALCLMVSVPAMAANTRVAVSMTSLDNMAGYAK